MTTDDSSIDASINGRATHAEMAEEPATRIAQPHAVPAGTLHSADSLLEGAAEALTRKAISMALSGHAPSMRLCLDRLASLRKDRPAPNVLPEITGPDDLPKATLALLRAVAAGEITPAEAAALAKLVEMHLQAIDTANVDTRLDRLEGLRESSAVSAGRNALGASRW